MPPETFITIFVYHSVTDTPSEFEREFDLSVPPLIFDRQLRVIKQKYCCISADDLLEEKVPSKAALITFDDGFLSYFTTAIPILLSNNLPSICFLNMEPIIGGRIFWSGLINYLCKSNDFICYLQSCLSRDLPKPEFLCCSKSIVNQYLYQTGIDVSEQVNTYTGLFADEQVLESVRNNSVVHFGNHLFNHDVPLLMTDDELIDSYRKNELALKKYPNYRNVFAFPFGGPEDCFSERQISLILDAGAKRVFSCSGWPNTNLKSPYLHRSQITSDYKFERA